MTAPRRMSPANALVHEAQLSHFLRVEQIAAIEHDRLVHHGAQFLKINLLLPEFIPLRADDERIRSRSDTIRIVTELNTGQNLARFFHRFRVISANFRAFFLQRTDNFQ